MLCSSVFSVVFFLYNRISLPSMTAPFVTRAASVVLRVSVRRAAQRQKLAFALLLPVIGLTGCGYFDSRTAHNAQISLIGMSSSDVRGCIGLPDKQQKLDDGTEVYEYVRSLNIPATNDSTLFPLQSVVNVVETTFGGAGKTCVADIRIADGKVTDVHYSGDNDEMVGADGVCSIITRGCTRRPMADMKPVSYNPLGPVNSFRQPQIQAQMPASTTPLNAPSATPVEAPPLSEQTIAAPTPATNANDIPSLPASTPAASGASQPVVPPNSATPIQSVTPTTVPTSGVATSGNVLSGAVTPASPPAAVKTAVQNTPPVTPDAATTAVSNSPSQAVPTTSAPSQNISTPSATNDTSGKTGSVQNKVFESASGQNNVTKTTSQPVQPKKNVTDPEEFSPVSPVPEDPSTP